MAADKRVHKTRPIPRASFQLSASISVPSLSIGLAVYSVVFISGVKMDITGVTSRLRYERIERSAGSAR